MLVLIDPHVAIPAGAEKTGVWAKPADAHGGPEAIVSAACAVVHKKKKKEGEGEKEKGQTKRAKKRRL